MQLRWLEAAAEYDAGDAWLGPQDRLEAVFSANELYWGAFETPPSKRLGLPVLDRFIDGLPPPIDELEQVTSSCFAGGDCKAGVSTASLVVDSCWLTSFGGAFDGDEDFVMIESIFNPNLGSHAAAITTGTDHDAGGTVSGAMQCKAGGNPTVYRASLEESGGNSSQAIRLSESPANRTCYLMGFRGDLNNGDEVRVAPTKDGDNWEIILVSDFSNGAGVEVRVGCTDSGPWQFFEGKSSGKPVAAWPLFEPKANATDPDIRNYCGLTRLYNDFAGVDEVATLSYNDLDYFSADWELNIHSNRPFDPGGDIEASAVCFR